MTKRWWRRGVVASLVLASWPMAGRAEEPAPTGMKARLRNLQATDEEAPLPDIDAIEKGARPPASMSFRRAGEAEVGSGPPPAAPGTANAVDGLRSSGGIYGLDQGEPAHEGGVAPAKARAESVPELHTVRKGDTLWNLCDYYYGDPWKWPQLWAQNPLITNPHWIFPGDVVRLRAPGEADEAMAAAQSGAPEPPLASRSVADRSVSLREAGFIAAGELKESAKISGSREEKIMLATGDQAYVQWSEKQPLKAGERYSIFKPDLDRPVRGPNGDVLGYMVRVYGDVLLDQVSDTKTGRGTLLAITEPVERGYFVSARVQTFKRVSPRPAAVSLEAKVVASFTPIVMLSADNFVVISRGAKDGVTVGNRSFVVRRGDGYRPVMEGWDNFDERFPKEVVGELWVISVQERTSVAWIARTQKEIRVGETVEMRKGY